MGGEISYSAGMKAQIDKNVTVPNGIHYHQPTDLKRSNVMFAWSELISLFASLVVGMVLISLWGKQIKEITVKMNKKISASFGWGTLVLFITPIIALILVFTLIGIPLALILLALWIIAIYLSSILEILAVYI